MVLLCWSLVLLQSTASMLRGVQGLDGPRLPHSPSQSVSTNSKASTCTRQQQTLGLSSLHCLAGGALIPSLMRRTARAEGCCRAISFKGPVGCTCGSNCPSCWQQALSAEAACKRRRPACLSVLRAVHVPSSRKSPPQGLPLMLLCTGLLHVVLTWTQEHGGCAAVASHLCDLVAVFQCNDCG